MFGIGFASLEGIVKKLSNESIEFVIALRPVAFFSVRNKHEALVAAQRGVVLGQRQIRPFP